METGPDGAAVPYRVDKGQAFVGVVSGQDGLPKRGVAAHARSQGETPVSNGGRHFDWVEGLLTASWV